MLVVGLMSGSLVIVLVEELGMLWIGVCAKKLRWICRAIALERIMPLITKTKMFLLVIGLIIG